MSINQPLLPIIGGVNDREGSSGSGTERCPAEAAPSTSAFEVALVSMPFAAALRPSIQVGLLKAIARKHGVDATTYHLSLDLAQRIGLPLYDRISGIRGLLGEWLFSLEAFGEDAPDRGGRFVDDFDVEHRERLAGLDVSRDDLLRLRASDVPRYLDHLMETIPWGRYQVVGFSSTFQQNAPSIALARRLKRAYPRIVTVFGGANLEAGMGLELIRAVPWIDHAVIGEGDATFPELLLALRDGAEPSDVPGVATLRAGGVVHRPREHARPAMDESPVPDYDEFFDRAESLGLIPAPERPGIGLPIETARGCWWGAKHHCTFCGLNGQSMSFRSKSPDRVIAETAELSRRHGVSHFEVVDNIIDHAYFRTLLPRLARERAGSTFFYEVKSNLSRDQIRLLAEAGVRRIQPGIESLSSRVLQSMRKGVSMLQNVNTLRWSLQHGIRVDWNFLWGFPGETAAEYERQAALIPLLFHLQPPAGGGRVWMERFSPLFTDRDAFPVRFLRPESSYAYVYPTDVDLGELAYFFEFEFENPLPDSSYEGLSRRLQEWKEAWRGPRRPSMTFQAGPAPDVLEIRDARDPEHPRLHQLHGLSAALLRSCCDRPQSVGSARGLASADASPDELERTLNDLCDRGLTIRDGEQFLCLALPTHEA